jgi:hypothetical protein
MAVTSLVSIDHRQADPDNDQMHYGVFETRNYVHYQPLSQDGSDCCLARSYVHPVYRHTAQLVAVGGINWDSYVSLLTVNPHARGSHFGLIVYNCALAYGNKRTRGDQSWTGYGGASVLPNLLHVKDMHSADEAIHLVYRYPLLRVGEVISFTFVYDFSNGVDYSNSSTAFSNTGASDADSLDYIGSVQFAHNEELLASLADILLFQPNDVMSGQSVPMVVAIAHSRVAELTARILAHATNAFNGGVPVADDDFVVSVLDTQLFVSMALYAQLRSEPSMRWHTLGVRSLYKCISSLRQLDTNFFETVNNGGYEVCGFDDVDSALFEDQTVSEIRACLYMNSTDKERASIFGGGSACILSANRAVAITNGPIATKMSLTTLYSVSAIEFCYGHDQVNDGYVFFLNAANELRLSSSFCSPTAAVVNSVTYGIQAVSFYREIIVNNEINSTLLAALAPTVVQSTTQTPTENIFTVYVSVTDLSVGDSVAVRAAVTVQTNGEIFELTTVVMGTVGQASYRPLITTLSEDYVYENSIPDTIVGYLTTFPYGTTYRYWLVCSNATNTEATACLPTYFYLNVTDTKQLLTGVVPIDYEALAPTFRMSIQVWTSNKQQTGILRNSYGCCLLTQFILNVMDVNEAPKQLSPQLIHVSADTTAGTVIAQNLTVTDPDYNQTHTIDLVNLDTSVGESFRIIPVWNTDSRAQRFKIILLRSISSLAGKDILLRVRVTDSGTPALSIFTTITIVISNLTVPAVAQQHLVYTMNYTCAFENCMIPNSIPIMSNVVVGQLSTREQFHNYTTNADINTVLEGCIYVIVPGLNASVFSVVASTGQIAFVSSRFTATEKNELLSLSFYVISIAPTGIRETLLVSFRFVSTSSNSSDAATDDTGRDSDDDDAKNVGSSFEFLNRTCWMPEYSTTGTIFASDNSSVVEGISNDCLSGNYSACIQQSLMQSLFTSQTHLQLDDPVRPKCSVRVTDIMTDIGKTAPAYIVNYSIKRINAVSFYNHADGLPPSPFPMAISPSGCVSVDPNTGILAALRECILSYNQLQLITVVVAASVIYFNASSAKDTVVKFEYRAHVTISVININQAPTPTYHFQNTLTESAETVVIPTYYVRENATALTTVVPDMIDLFTDADDSAWWADKYTLFCCGEKRYKIVQCEGAVNADDAVTAPFSISDASVGTVVLSDSHNLHFWTRSRYLLCVSVSDKGNLTSAHREVHVNVLEVNKPPKCVFVANGTQSRRVDGNYSDRAISLTMFDNEIMTGHVLTNGYFSCVDGDGGYYQNLTLVLVQSDSQTVSESRAFRLKQQFDGVVSDGARAYDENLPYGYALLSATADGNITTGLDDVDVLPQVYRGSQFFVAVANATEVLLHSSSPSAGRDTCTFSIQLRVTDNGVPALLSEIPISVYVVHVPKLPVCYLSVLELFVNDNAPPNTDVGKPLLYNTCVGDPFSRQLVEYDLTFTVVPLGDVRAAAAFTNENASAPLLLAKYAPLPTIDIILSLLGVDTGTGQIYTKNTESNESALSVPTLAFYVLVTDMATMMSTYICVIVHRVYNAGPLIYVPATLVPQINENVPISDGYTDSGRFVRVFGNQAAMFAANGGNVCAQKNYEVVNVMPKYTGAAMNGSFPFSIVSTYREGEIPLEGDKFELLSMAVFDYEIQSSYIVTVRATDRDSSFVAPNTDGNTFFNLPPYECIDSRIFVNSDDISVPPILFDIAVNIVDVNDAPTFIAQVPSRMQRCYAAVTFNLVSLQSSTSRAPLTDAYNTQDVCFIVAEDQDTQSNPASWGNLTYFVDWNNVKCSYISPVILGANLSNDVCDVLFEELVTLDISTQSNIATLTISNLVNISMAVGNNTAADKAQRTEVLRSLNGSLVIFSFVVNVVDGGGLSDTETLKLFVSVDVAGIIGPDPGDTNQTLPSDTNSTNTEKLLLTCHDFNELRLNVSVANGDLISGTSIYVMENVNDVFDVIELGSSGGFRSGSLSALNRMEYEASFTLYDIRSPMDSNVFVVDCAGANITRQQNCSLLLASEKYMVLNDAAYIRPVELMLTATVFRRPPMQINVFDASGGDANNSIITLCNCPVVIYLTNSILPSVLLLNRTLLVDQSVVIDGDDLSNTLLPIRFHGKVLPPSSVTVTYLNRMFTVTNGEYKLECVSCASCFSEGQLSHSPTLVQALISQGNYSVCNPFIMNTTTGFILFETNAHTLDQLLVPNYVYKCTYTAQIVVNYQPWTGTHAQSYSNSSHISVSSFISIAIVSSPLPPLCRRQNHVYVSENTDHNVFDSEHPLSFVNVTSDAYKTELNFADHGVFCRAQCALEYILLANTETFTVNASTGAIFIASGARSQQHVFDFEVQPVYELVVQVRDVGSQLSCFVTVWVYVTNVPDCQILALYLPSGDSNLATNSYKELVQAEPGDTLHIFGSDLGIVPSYQDFSGLVSATNVSVYLFNLDYISVPLWYPRSRFDIEDEYFYPAVIPLRNCTQVRSSNTLITCTLPDTSVGQRLSVYVSIDEIFHVGSHTEAGWMEPFVNQPHWCGCYSPETISFLPPYVSAVNLSLYSGHVAAMPSAYDDDTGIHSVSGLTEIIYTGLHLGPKLVDVYALNATNHSASDRETEAASETEYLALGPNVCKALFAPSEALLLPLLEIYTNDNSTAIRQVQGHSLSQILVKDCIITAQFSIASAVIEVAFDGDVRVETFLPGTLLTGFEGGIPRSSSFSTALLVSNQMSNIITVAGTPAPLSSPTLMPVQGPMESPTAALTHMPTIEKNSTRMITIYKASVLSCVGANDLSIVLETILRRSVDGSTVGHILNYVHLVYWSLNSPRTVCACHNNSVNETVINEYETDATGPRIITRWLCYCEQPIHFTMVYIQLSAWAQPQTKVIYLSNVYALHIRGCSPHIESVSLLTQKFINSNGFGASTAGGDVIAVRGRHLEFNNATLPSANNAVTDSFSLVGRMEACASMLSSNQSEAVNLQGDAVMMSYWSKSGPNVINVNNRTVFEARCCSLLTDRVIACVLRPGTGTNITWQLRYKVKDQSSFLSNAVPSSISYGSPEIAFISVGANVSGPTSNKVMSNGLTVYINGYNLGSDMSTLNRVNFVFKYQHSLHFDGTTAEMYGIVGSDMENRRLLDNSTAPDLILAESLYEFDLTDTCVMTRPHVQIACTVGSAVGTNLLWSVLVDGQKSGAPVTSYAPPTITAVRVLPITASSLASSGEIDSLQAFMTVGLSVLFEMCPVIGTEGASIEQSAAAVQDCVAAMPIAVMSVDGGQIVFINGLNFGPTSVINNEGFDNMSSFVDYVKYGPSGVEYLATDCVVLFEDTLLACISVLGVGFNHSWTVSIANQASAPSFSQAALTSYESVPKLAAVVPAHCPTVGNCNVALFGKGFLAVQSDLHVTLANLNIHQFPQFVTELNILSDTRMNITVPPANLKTGPFVFIQAWFIYYTACDGRQRYSSNKILFVYDPPKISVAKVVPCTLLSNSRGHEGRGVQMSYTLLIFGESFTSTPNVQVFSSCRNFSNSSLIKGLVDNETIPISGRIPVILTDCKVNTAQTQITCPATPFPEGNVMVETFTSGHQLTYPYLGAGQYRAVSTFNYSSINKDFNRNNVTTTEAVILASRILVGSARTEGNIPAQPAVLEIIGQNLVRNASLPPSVGNVNSSVSSTVLETWLGTSVYLGTPQTPSFSLVLAQCPVIGFESLTITSFVRSMQWNQLLSTLKPSCSISTTETTTNPPVLACLGLKAKENIQLLQCLLPPGHGSENYILVNPISDQPYSSSVPSTALSSPAGDSWSGATKTVCSKVNNANGSVEAGCFAYAAPVIRSVSPMWGNRSGGYMVTIWGDNFAIDKTTISGNVFVLVGTIRWEVDVQRSSQTMLMVTSEPGAGTQLAVEVIAYGLRSLPSSNKAAQFNYFLPTITTNISSWMLLTDGVTITANSGNCPSSLPYGVLSGNNFNVGRSSVSSFPLVIMDSNTVLSVHNVSDTELWVVVPPGTGRSHTLAVYFDNQTIHVAVVGYLNYEPPVVTDVVQIDSCPPLLNNCGLVGCQVILKGRNFGIPDLATGENITTGTLMVHVGTFGRANVISVNSTVIVFFPPKGFGANVPISVEVGGQVNSAGFTTSTKGQQNCSLEMLVFGVGLLPATLSYDPPIIVVTDVIDASSAPDLQKLWSTYYTNSYILRIFGSSFGSEDFVTVTITVNMFANQSVTATKGELCDLITHADTLLECLLPLTLFGANISVLVSFRASGVDLYDLHTFVSLPVPTLSRLVVLGHPKSSATDHNRNNSTYDFINNDQWYNFVGDDRQDSRSEAAVSGQIIRIYVTYLPLVGIVSGNLESSEPAAVVLFSAVSPTTISISSTGFSAETWTCSNISVGSSTAELTGASSGDQLGPRISSQNSEYFVECVAPPMSTGRKMVSVFIAGQKATNTLTYSVPHCPEGFYGMHEGEQCSYCGINALVTGFSCPLDGMVNPYAGRGWFIKQLPLTEARNFSRTKSQRCSPEALRSSVRTTCPVALSCDIRFSNTISESLAMHTASHCTGRDNECSFPYSGERCSECENGYMLINGDCSRCSSEISSKVLYALGALLGLLCLYLACVSVSAQWILVEEMAHISTPQYVKYSLSLSYISLVVFAQFFTPFIQTTAFSRSLPNSVQTVLTVQSILLAMNVDTNTLYGWIWCEGMGSSRQCIHNTFLTVNIINTGVLFLLGFLAYKVVKHRSVVVVKSSVTGGKLASGHYGLSARRLLSVSLFWLLSVSYFVARTNLSLFNCFEVYPSDGYSYLLSLGVNEESVCSSPSIRRLQALAVVGLLVTLFMVAVLVIGLMSILRLAHKYDHVVDDGFSTGIRTNKMSSQQSDPLPHKSEGSAADETTLPNEDCFDEIALTTEEECKVNFEEALGIIASNSIGDNEVHENSTTPANLNSVGLELLMICVFVVIRTLLCIAVILFRYQQGIVYAVGTSLSCVFFMVYVRFSCRRVSKPQAQKSLGSTLWPVIAYLDNYSIVAAGQSILAFILLWMVGVPLTPGSKTLTAFLLTCLFHLVFWICIFLLLLRILSCCWVLFSGAHVLPHRETITQVNTFTALITSTSTSTSIITHQAAVGAQTTTAQTTTAHTNERELNSRRKPVQESRFTTVREQMLRWILQVPKDLPSGVGTDGAESRQDISGEVIRTTETVINPLVFTMLKLRPSSTSSNPANLPVDDLPDDESKSHHSVDAARNPIHTAFEERIVRGDTVAEMSSRRYAHLVRKPSVRSRQKQANHQDCNDDIDNRCTQTKQQDVKSCTTTVVCTTRAMKSHIVGSAEICTVEATEEGEDVDGSATAFHTTCDPASGCISQGDGAVYTELIHSTEYRSLIDETTTTLISTTSKTVGAPGPRHLPPKPKSIGLAEYTGQKYTGNLMAQLLPPSSSSSQAAVPTPPQPVAADLQSMQPLPHAPLLKSPVMASASASPTASTEPVWSSGRLPPPPPPIPLLNCRQKSPHVKGSLSPSNVFQDAPHVSVGSAADACDAPNLSTVSDTDTNLRMLKATDVRRVSLTRENRGNPLLYDPDRVLIRNTPYIPRKVKPPPKP